MGLWDSRYIYIIPYHTHTSYIYIYIYIVYILKYAHTQHSTTHTAQHRAQFETIYNYNNTVIVPIGKMTQHGRVWV